MQNQTPIPKSLQDACAQKKLVPLVGAGVSMSLKRAVTGECLFPSWKELLTRAANRLLEESKPLDADAVTAMLNKGNFQLAADFAREGLTGGLWNQFFKDQFDVLQADVDPVSLALPQAVWTLGKRVVTLNYDRVLRFACPQSNDLRELDNAARNELADFARAPTSANSSSSSRYSIWHLHGRLDSLEKIIFTSESYNKLYLEKDPDYKAGLVTLQSLCRDAILLFVGCSLDDAELLQQIGTVHGIFGENTGPHYALVHHADHAAIKAKLAGLPIELVCFSGFGQPLLDQIAAISGSSATTASPATPAPAATPAAAIPRPSPPAAKPATRIAVLSANPIGDPLQYDALLKGFKALKCTVHFFPLTVKALNELDQFNYIVILSKLVKGKLVIEDAALQSGRIGLRELEQEIGVSDPDGVFIFLPQQEIAAPEADDIATLALPTVVFPALSAAQIDSLGFKLFKKADLAYFSGCRVANQAGLKLLELSGKPEPQAAPTRLPAAIDPKTVQHFVGRSGDLAEICRKVVELQEQNEVLTIKGSGGIGKTILIKKIAVELSRRNLFADGIDFVDCEFIADYPMFKRKLVAGFGLENVMEVEQYLKQHAAKQARLIILDNVETLLYLEGQQQIKDFIAFMCDYATIVLTSRERLGLDCEQVAELRRFTTDEAFALFEQELQVGGAPLLQDEALRRFVRQEIVETLLDNNPLAIKLVTKNIPGGKDFHALKRELEADLFRKTSDDELEQFDRVADGNIERKKSLYASIHFSYRNLNEAEQVAFELLSLFPDGIDIEALKMIADKRKEAHRKGGRNPAPGQPPTASAPVDAGPVIGDAVIRALQNKSMVQVDNGLIKLQSIVGKFAERQLQLREAGELARHRRRALEYNIAVLQDIRELYREDRYRSAKRFDGLQANFYQSLAYLAPAKLPAAVVADYLERMCNLSIAVSASAVLAQALEQRPELSGGDASLGRCIAVLALKARYYAGGFADAVPRLRQLLPPADVVAVARESRVGWIAAWNAMGIYGMEGAALLHLEFAIETKMDYGKGYPDTLFRLGEFDQPLLALCRPDFFSLEARLASGVLTHAELERYLAVVYPKDHLELMQAHYLKAKLGSIDPEAVRKLASVNPYTLGLQQLMLAMAETDSAAKGALFESALDNLRHIHYYYVEALLLFATFLQQDGQAGRYAEVQQQGWDLACQHHYRTLRHRFEDLARGHSTPYRAAAYPLPDGLDDKLKGYVKFLIKDRQG